MKTLLFTSFFILFCSVKSFTQTDSTKRVEFNGYVRGSVFGGGNSYNYSSLFGELSLITQYKGSKSLIYSQVRFRAGDQFGKRYSTVDIVETYGGYSDDRMDILLGNQIVSWGRTDGFSPTNNITPSDYFFLTANPNDQLLSNFMLRAKLRLTSQIDADIILIPVYRSSNYRFDLFEMGNNVRFSEATLPSKKIENGSVALKLNFELFKVGFALSYFRGFDPYYGFRIESVLVDNSTGYPIITNSATPYLKNTFGADIAIPMGSWIVRGEFAYNITKGYQTEMHIPNPSLAYVLGIEKELLGFHTIFQYIGKYSLDYKDLEIPTMQQMINYEFELLNRKIFNQQERFNNALSLSVSKNLASEILNIELAGYYNLTSKEYLIRPKLSWRITDDLTASFGGLYMNGPEKSIFDYSNHIMNGGFIEVKVNF